MSYHIYFIAGDFDPSRPQAVPEASTRPQAITLTRDHPVVPAPVASHMVHRPRPSVPVRPRPSTPISLPVPPRPATLIPPTPTTSSPLTSPSAPAITTVTDQAGQQFPTDIIALGPKSASATTRSRSPLPRRRRHPSPDRHVEHPLSRPPGIWHDNELTGVWSPYSPLPTPYSAFPLPTRPDRAITTQEADFRAWLRQQQDPNRPMTSEQLKYVASSLCLAQLDIAQLRPLQVFEFDPTWTHPLCEDPPTIQYFYVLPILQFKSRLGFGEDIPPKPRRALNADGRDAIEHIQLVHATSPGGLRGILTEAKLRPSKLHQADSCSFFAIGYRKSFDLQQDRWETARVLKFRLASEQEHSSHFGLVFRMGRRKKL